ncbi:unnamed protein product [Gadus morhua 'NCC']
MTFVQGIAVVIRESSKRKELYESMFGCDAVVTILALKDDKSVRGETRAKIGGLYKQALKAKTYFGLLCCEALFEPCEAVARSLQHSKASALGALECTEFLGKRMEALRDDKVVENMLHKTWLRTTMTQKRLTHLALMHMHGHILDSLDIDSLMRSFISANPERKATFGVV